MDQTEARMTWADVLADPSLRDLPYKVELSGDGKIIMSPASFDHAARAGSVRPANTADEMLDKAQRYLEAGAEEVWIIDRQGNKTVHKRP